MIFCTKWHVRTTVRYNFRARVLDMQAVYWWGAERLEEMSTFPYCQKYEANSTDLENSSSIVHEERRVISFRREMLQISYVLHGSSAAYNLVVAAALGSTNVRITNMLAEPARAVLHCVLSHTITSSSFHFCKMILDSSPVCSNYNVARSWP